MDKYNAAYINALSEERDPKILFEWIVQLHREKIDLEEELKEAYNEIRHLDNLRNYE